MIVGILAEIILFMVIAYVPFFQLIFGTTAIHVEHLALLLICPVILIILEEGLKLALKNLCT